MECHLPVCGEQMGWRRGEQGRGPVDGSVCEEGEMPSFSRGKALLGTEECLEGFGGMDLAVWDKRTLRFPSEVCLGCCSSMVCAGLQSRRRILFDRQARNVLTELQTTGGSAAEIILIHRHTQLAFFPKMARTSCSIEQEQKRALHGHGFFL